MDRDSYIDTAIYVNMDVHIVKSCSRTQPDYCWHHLWMSWETETQFLGNTIGSLFERPIHHSLDVVKAEVGLTIYETRDCSGSSKLIMPCWHTTDQHCNSQEACIERYSGGGGAWGPDQLWRSHFVSISFTGSWQRRKEESVTAKNWERNSSLGSSGSLCISNPWEWSVQGCSQQGIL